MNGAGGQAHTSDGPFSRAAEPVFPAVELVPVSHLEGEVVHGLNENDVRAGRRFPDDAALCGGHFCLHYPSDQYDFRLGDWKWIPVPDFGVPFRCLYSRNIDNLMMAGKHISVTHIAGSATKTMLNGGQTGVAVGAAAALCKKYDTTLRGVYRDHVKELHDLIAENRSRDVQ